MKKVLKILFIPLSAFLSILFLLVLTNYYLKWTGTGKESHYFNSWIYDAMDFSPDYVFWGKSFCSDKNPCPHEKEKLLTHEIEVFYPSNLSTNSSCLKILFLGDSFTISPWMENAKTFPAVFSQSLAENKKRCIEQYRLATGGTGPDQQFARFSDIADEISPNIVIWQFYANDYFESARQDVYTIQEGKLKRKKQFLNSFFLGGFITQKIPFLRETTLGKHLMYMGENQDVFRNLTVNPLNYEAMTQYADKKFVLFLDEMQKLAQQKNFTFYTTLAPLECQIDKTTPCNFSDEEQDQIRIRLKQHGRLLSMEELTQLDQKVLGATTGDLHDLFGHPNENSPIGNRHLSEQGNEVFGKILYENFTHISY